MSFFIFLLNKERVESDDDLRRLRYDRCGFLLDRCFFDWWWRWCFRFTKQEDYDDDQKDENDGRGGQYNLVFEEGQQA